MLTEFRLRNVLENLYVEEQQEMEGYDMTIDIRELICENGRLMETNRSGPVEDIIIIIAIIITVSIKCTYCELGN